MVGMIKVTVNCVFLEEQSMPEEFIFVWAYHLKIVNKEKEEILINYREFEIIDSKSQVEVIKGIGVFDSIIHINDGGVFEYVGGVMLSSPSGVFTGKLMAQKKSNEVFEVAIPSFSLDSPYEIARKQ
jgi:ApaG protein